MDRVAEIFWQEIMDKPYHLSGKGYARFSGMRDCPMAYPNGQILRCRYVAWAFGLLKDPIDTVHHKDKDKLNDHPDNFEIISREAHSLLHASLMSSEHKAKIRESLKGHLVSEATKRRLSESHKGLKQTSAAKAKVSAAMKGREITWGAKISATHKARGIKPPGFTGGKPLSDEHKAKLSETTKRVWQERSEKYVARRQEWQAMRERGSTLREIAMVFGVSVPTVSTTLSGGRKAAVVG